MGYYTEYEMTVKAKTEAELNDAIDFLNQISRISFVKAEFNTLHRKWYEHEADLKKLTHKMQAIEVELDGDGEESGDVWIKRFKQWKMQVSRQTQAMTPFSDWN